MLGKGGAEALGRDELDLLFALDTMPTPIPSNAMPQYIDVYCVGVITHNLLNKCCFLPGLGKVSQKKSTKKCGDLPSLLVFYGRADHKWGGPP